MLGVVTGTLGVVMKVAITGGGIGGLAAGLCLAERGHDVSIFEQARSQSAVGAGIQVSPNASRVLSALDLWEPFTAIATFPERIVLRRWMDDSELRVSDLGSEFRQRFGFDYANVHRGDLARLLAEALEARHNIQVEFSSEVTGVTTGSVDRPATLLLADGSTIETDAIIGADGIHSSVRSALFGNQPARFSGAVAYRALIPREAVPDSRLDVTNRLGPDAHVVTYVIGRNNHLLNLVCVMPEDTWRTESWTEIGSVEVMRAFHSGWSRELRSILEAVPEPVYRWALHDREPLQKWSVGNVTLLGDACHPMLPFMAQGACQAIEDAWILARELDAVDSRNSDDIARALRRYERARQERTTTVQTLSYRNRDIYHLPDGEAQIRRDDAMRSRSGGFADVDWLYGFDPTMG